MSGTIAHTRAFSRALPQLETEQDIKNFEILQYLAQRPVDTAFRIGALAGLGVTMRDMSLVLNSIYQRDVRGIDHPEIAAQEIKNTIKTVESLGKPIAAEVKEQLMLHITRIIPELATAHLPKDNATARSKVALCSKHDQEVLYQLFPDLLNPPRCGEPSQSLWSVPLEDTAAAPAAASAATQGADRGTDEAEATASAAATDTAVDSEAPAFAAASTASSSSSSGNSGDPTPAAGFGTESSGLAPATPTRSYDDLEDPAALAQEARIMHASGRFSRVRFPVWDVAKLPDSPAVGQSLRPRHMNKLPWMALLPPHVEVSYQTMTAIPLFPMQEASYPEFVDFDYAMYYLSRFSRRYKRSRARVRCPRR